MYSYGLLRFWGRAALRKSDRFTTTSHSDLALARSGLKISWWSPVDAVYTLWFREAVYRAARRMSRAGPHCCRWIEH
jgi:hypothetical protein